MKKVLIGVLGLVVIIVGVGFILPSQIHVERSIVIDAKTGIIFEQVNQLSNWPKWNMWEQKDTAMLSAYEGPEAGEGAVHKWSSEDPEIGTGSKTIINSAKNDSIVLALDFESNGNGMAFWYFEETDSGVTVTNAFNTDLGMNPIARYFGLMMPGMIGEAFETSLSQLRTLAESIPSYSISTANEEMIGDILYISKRDSASTAEVGTKMTTIFNELIAVVKDKKGSVNGAPMTLYYESNTENIVFEAAIPVANKIRVPEGVSLNTLSKIKAWSAMHTGDYAYLPSSHKKMLEKIKAGGKESVGMYIEQYLTNPTKETDSQKWKTKLIYPVQ